MNLFAKRVKFNIELQITTKLNLKYQNMKKALISLFVCLLVNITTQAGIPASMNDAIKNGDGEKLSVFFDESVDLKVLEKENIFSRAQARIIVKDFFTNNKVQSFAIQHEGGPESAPFVIGTLITNTGTFRVYCLLKKNAGQLFIQKFRLERQ